MQQLGCDCLAPRLSLVLLELNLRFFNNLRETPCCEMASMNAWRDGDEVALRLQRTSPLEVVLLSYIYIYIYVHKTTLILAFTNLAPKKGLFCNA
ncbi:hypothetical protein E2C01_098061 [Portunus trituberculatus]|uniref:Uncharacterized protein n=1 Tax=Portunus trituberculatus TaxID=210409 RepID=A0A5B7KD12_PORTR|nr:hypothetical protein [Portunus trituberculatus]